MHVKEKNIYGYLFLKDDGKIRQCKANVSKQEYHAHLNRVGHPDAAISPVVHTGTGRASTAFLSFSPGLESVSRTY